LDGYGLLVCDGKAIASGEIVAKGVHASSQDLEPCRPARLDAVLDRLSWQERGQVEAGVLMNGH
jgi:hypothetical protein